MSIWTKLNTEADVDIIDNEDMVFNLYVFEDYTHKQIAQTLGISEGTSKSQLAYAKKMLKKYVER